MWGLVEERRSEELCVTRALPVSRRKTGRTRQDERSRPSSNGQLRVRARGFSPRTCAFGSTRSSAPCSRPLGRSQNRIRDPAQNAWTPGGSKTRQTPDNTRGTRQPEEIPDPYQPTTTLRLCYPDYGGRYQVPFQRRFVSSVSRELLSLCTYTYARFGTWICVPYYCQRGE